MKKRKFLAVVCIVVIVVLIIIAGVFLFREISDNRQKKLSLDILAEDTYQSVFLSMYDISTFSEEDFAVYRGIPVKKVDYCFATADYMNEAVAAVFSSGNRITNIYMGLDPLMLWHSEKDDISEVQREFDTGWLAYADLYPEIRFEILFSFPSMEYWLKIDERERESALALYQQMTTLLTSRNNVICYFAGGQEWLINNPANYMNSFVANELISQKIFLLTFCDHALQITDINASAMVQQLSELIDEAIEHPAEYPDLSGWDIVFMGDSIIGNYEGSISIPGVVNGLTGASVYNCGRGGTPAAQIQPDRYGFPRMAEEFIKGIGEEDSVFLRGVQEYSAGKHEGKKLCFILNYGLNDYFGEMISENTEDADDIGTYAGAMRAGISILKEKYPDALYVMMGPGRVTAFEDGTEPRGEKGERLADFYEQAVSLSEELGIPYIDIYKKFPDGEDDLTDILADGVHYNEYGRYLAGKKIIDSLDSIVR